MAERLEKPPVGKGNPPATSRYPEGKSGNPAGRPKGKKNLKTIVQAVAQEMQTIEVDGTRREMPTSSLLILMLQRRALQGDYGAKRLLDEVREKFGEPEGNSDLRVIVSPKRLNMDEFAVVAVAARKRMLWAQEQRLKDDAAARSTAASSDPGSKPLEKPSRYGPVREF